MKNLFNPSLTCLFIILLCYVAFPFLVIPQNSIKNGFEQPQEQNFPLHAPGDFIEYCIPYLDCSYGDGFESFALGDIENYNSGCSPDAYGDFTNMISYLEKGENYVLFAETIYGENYFCVWIDYNDNGEFEADELLIEDFFMESGGQLYEVPVTIPADAGEGEHRLRARAIWDESANDPCGEFNDGETEDYTVNITGGGIINDVGILSIDIDGQLPPGPVITKVTVKNFGTETQTIQLSIINGIDYGTSTFVEDILPGETRQVIFGEWDAQIGTYTFHSYFTNGDDNPDNNQLFKEVVVQNSTLAYGYTPDLGEGFGSTISFDSGHPEAINIIGPSVADEILLCACWYNNMIYTVQENGGLFSIAPSTGEMTFIGTTIPDVTGLAFDGNTMYASTGTTIFPLGIGFSVLYEINPNTGETTAIEVMSSNAGLVGGIACDDAGNLFGFDAIDNNFFSIDKNTAVATSIGNLNLPGLYGTDISIHKKSNTCYLVGGLDAPGLFTIDLNTGQANPAGEFPEGTEVMTLAIPGINLLPPQNLQALTEENGVFLSWQASPPATTDNYNIYRNGLLVASTSENEYADLCMLPGTYDYTVTSVFEGSESAPTQPANVIIANCHSLLREEGFEAYSAGQQLVVQAESMGIDYWHCWSTPAGSDEDPYISDEVVFEGNNAMLIEGLNDAYMELGLRTDGKYELRFKLFVPAGFDGFFGVWREKSSGSFGAEAYFNEDETGFAIMANSDWQGFTYLADVWNEIQVVIDLDNDWGKLYLNETMICQAQWSLEQSGEPGPLMLDVVDFYAGVLWEGDPTSIVDNIEFKKITDDLLPPLSLQAISNTNTIDLSWEAPSEGIFEYLIFRDGVETGSADSTHFSDLGLSTGTYEYEIRALYGECESLPTEPVTAIIHPFQTITIPSGWSGFSSSLNPDNPNVELVFEGIFDELIILQNDEGIFWPEEDVNTIGNLSTHDAYKIKVTEEVELTIYGEPETNHSISLVEGWNLLPVISLCDVDIESLFATTDVIIIKEVAGYDMYWPEFGINSLGVLKPGKGYFVLMGAPATIEFPDCLKTPEGIIIPK